MNLVEDVVVEGDEEVIEDEDDGENMTGHNMCKRVVSESAVWFREFIVHFDSQIYEIVYFVLIVPSTRRYAMLSLITEVAKIL